MGKWKHRLSNIDTKTLTADCSSCGSVKIGKARDNYYRCQKALNETSRVGKLKRKYNIDTTKTSIPTECEICNGKTRIAVDHCHKTGRVRGFLCMKCNTALGLVDDNVEILKKLIEYLER